MHRKTRVRSLLFILLCLLMVACRGRVESPINFTETPIPPTSAPTMTPEPSTQTPTIHADTPMPTIKFTAIDTLPPTPSATSTDLPAGYRIVPDVVGLHYLDARQVLYAAGFTFLYRATCLISINHSVRSSNNTQQLALRRRPEK